VDMMSALTLVHGLGLHSRDVQWCKNQNQTEIICQKVWPQICDGHIRL